MVVTSQLPCKIADRHASTPARPASRYAERMALKFTKMHGLGNDFVVIDATREPFVPDRFTLRRLADRRRGVGCDQILVIDPPPRADVDFGYRIYNADGSEVGQCGNGARCLARYVREHRLSDKAELRVATATTAMTLQLLDDGRVRVNMGTPRFTPAEIPLAAPAVALRYAVELPDYGRIEFGAVGLGNPHAVIEVADIDAAPVAELGRALQRHPWFPQSVNVGFAQFVDPQRLRLRVFERGVGETEACGSGAAAAFAIGRRWGRLATAAEVVLRGGALQVCWGGEGETLWMTGPAETSYEGCLP